MAWNVRKLRMGISNAGVVTRVPVRGVEWLIFLRNPGMKEKENDDAER